VTDTGTDATAYPPLFHRLPIDLSRASREVFVVYGVDRARATP